MINNNLERLASISNNYKLDSNYSTKNTNLEANINSNNSKKDTISISSLTAETISCRESRLQALKEQIRNGEYKIDNTLTSKAIIEELKFLK